MNKPTTSVRSSSGQVKLNSKILLAEDNLANQEVAIGMLMALGYDIVLAENGHEAVQSFKDHSYDLVLMDCHMPEMDGFLASEAIRNYEQSRQSKATPIIALNADVQKGIQEQCLAAGMNAFLSKPLKKTELIELLAQWLSDAHTVSAEQVKAVLHQQKSENIFDPSLLQQLRDWGEQSGRDILGRSVNHFLHNTPGNMAEIHQALDSNEPETLRLLVHNMKSSSANLGAKKLPEYCAELEAAARDNELSNAPVLIKKIDEALKQFLDALKTYTLSNSNLL